MIFLNLSIIDWISQPWPWAVSGFVIALILLLSTWAGKSFGVSSTYKVMCSIAGAGKRNPFFDINLKSEYWRLAFAAGAVLGGYIGVHFLGNEAPLAISQVTIDHLQNTKEALFSSARFAIFRASSRFPNKR